MAGGRGRTALLGIVLVGGVSCSTADRAPARPGSCAASTQQAMAGAEPADPVPIGPDVDASRVKAGAASDFVDAVGVNIHVTYTDTPYSDDDKVLEVLRDSGVRHVRDAVVPDRFDATGSFLERLHSQGGCAQLIVGGERVDEQELGESVDFLRDHSHAVASVEGPNELDLKEVSDWPELGREQQQQLFEGVRGASETSPLPVASLSVGRLRAFDAVGDLSKSVDLLNLHPYPGGEPPEGAIEPHVAAARALAEDTPVVITETGYHDAVNDEESQPAVTEQVEAVYLPRLLLDAHALGVVRTYLYELVDEFPDDGDSNDQASFGLYRRDWSPKPAADSVRTLLHLLSAAPEAGPGSVDMAVRAPDDQDLRAVLLGDADGFWLAVWRAVSIYDNEGDQLLEPPAVPAVVLLGQSTDVDVYRPGDSGEPVTSRQDVASVRLEVDAEVQLLRLKRP